MRMEAKIAELAIQVTVFHMVAMMTMRIVTKNTMDFGKLHEPVASLTTRRSSTDEVAMIRKKVFVTIHF